MSRLFIHIPKNAGMSIRHADFPGVGVAGAGRHISAAYTEAVRQKMTANNEHHGFEHARWRDVAVSIRDRFPAFAIVRNPWARVASRYFFGLQVATQGKPESSNYTFTTFDEFLEERHRWGDEPYYWHRAVRGWYQQRDYVTDELGELKCTVLRCEHLGEDLFEYMRETLPERRRNVTELPEQFREMTSLMELYTEEQIQIVADWYAKDIEAFGFDFDSAATRGLSP